MPAPIRHPPRYRLWPGGPYESSAAPIPKQNADFKTGKTLKKRTAATARAGGAPEGPKAGGGCPRWTARLGGAEKAKGGRLRPSGASDLPSAALGLCEALGSLRGWTG